MKNSISKLGVGQLKGLASGTNILMSYLTFWLVDSNQMDFSILHNHLTYLIAAILVGVATYMTITIITVLVDKVSNKAIEDNTNDLVVAVNGHAEEIKSLNERLYINWVIAYERFPDLYPRKTGQGNNGHGRVFETTEQVQMEIERVRNNLRVNRKRYNISLDEVENVLEIMYGEYMPKRNEDEPDRD